MQEAVSRLPQVLAVLTAFATAPAEPARATAARAQAPPGWAPDFRAAAGYARGRDGEVSFSVSTGRRRWERRPRMAVSSASVIKAMLLVAYLDRPDVRRRLLHDGDRLLLAPMVRYSDNDAASRVLEIVGYDSVVRLARRARMRDFEIALAWGLSQTTAADQARWFLRLPDLTPRRHRAYALTLLRTIVPEQRWGVAEVRPRGWTLHFKGGWGSGTGAVSHQVALLVRGNQRVALAIMTTGSPTHAYSETTLRGVALRLVRGLAAAPRQPRKRSAPARWTPATTWAPTAFAWPGWRDRLFGPPASRRVGIAPAAVPGLARGAEDRATGDAAVGYRMPISDWSPTMKR